MTDNPIDRPSSPRIPSPDWYLVTNHLNLYYLIGAGLILSESGFGNKYYKDVLSLFPGRIVLFPHSVPAGAIDMAKEEASHLIPCIAQVNLKGLTGPVTSIDQEGRVRQGISFPNELDGNEAALIIPAPLPIFWVDKIYFESMAVIRQFKESADDFINVDHRIFQIKTKKTLFQPSKKTKQDKQLFVTHEAFPWPRAGDLIKDLPTSFNRAIAAGGIMAMLHRMADRSSAAALAFYFAFDPHTDTGQEPVDPLIHRPWQWAQDDSISSTGQTLSEKMFWGAVNAIADFHRGHGMDARDAVFDFLKNVVISWQDVATNENRKNALQNLIEELESLGGTSDSTISELLDRHPKPFSRAIILFFLRDDCQSLLEYRNEKLNDTDIIATAILFGAREGWLALPNELKATRPLQHAVTHGMAALAHQFWNTGINVGTAPPLPPIFRDLFKPINDKWTAKQKKAALHLSKHKKWDCLQTIIDLGKGVYQLKVVNSGVQIIMDGAEKKISHEVDMPSFLKQLDRELSKQDICGRLRQDLHKILGCIQ